MTEKNKNLLVRVVSSFTLLPLVLWLFWMGGLWTGALLAWAAGTCAAEYYLITHNQKLSPLLVFGSVVASVLPLLPVLHPSNPWDPAFWLVGATYLVTWMVLLVRGPHAEAPVRSAHLLAGIMYGGMGMGALSSIQVQHGLVWAVTAMTVTWANDTLAYFAGRFFGRHKLAPTVSPKKTWEGFAGGMVGSILGLFIQTWVFFPGTLRPLDCLVLGVAGGIAGPMGDLCESMLKRTYGVKDSGTIIPGHGGILDRLDALLFNAPLVYLYVQFLRP